jgi:aminopeptidase N
VVHDFRWGGMENISATTLTERTLHDEAAHLTFRSDDLVCHELAHSWFGDMITCRSWSHIWLNESFGSFAEIIYYEAKWGEDGLAEQLLGQRHAYLEEYEEAYRRAIVTDVYGEPEDMFDAHTTRRLARLRAAVRARVVGGAPLRQPPGSKK